MGILVSLPALTHRSLQNLNTKRKARKARKRQEDHQGLRASESQTPTPRPQAQEQREREEKDSLDILRQGLKGEHLASSPPSFKKEGGTAVGRVSAFGTRDCGGRELPRIGTVAGFTKYNVAEKDRLYSTESGSKPPPSTTKATDLEQGDAATSPLTHQQTTITMASDSDYASFLDKANQDPSAGTVHTSGKDKGGFKATDEGVKVPTVLKKAVVDAYYTSDGDEPFEVVGLRFEGGKLPDEATFAKMINHPTPAKAEVGILDVAEWDPQGQYTEIVDAVREAAKGSDVRVYRVKKGGARVEYWVVGLEGGNLVGARALSVES